MSAVVSAWPFTAVKRDDTRFRTKGFRHSEVRMRFLPLAAGLGLAASAARADDFRVTDIRAYLFYSNSGRLSERLNLR